jgi:hypothetical protein
MPVVPTLQITAAPNGQGGWSGSANIPIAAGTDPKVYAYNVVPSPGPYPSDEPSSSVASVTGPAGTYDCSYQITQSSPQQVAIRVTINPPSGGFTPGTLKLAVTLSYGAGGGIPT